jgi:DNA-binding NarL/FixJ family response regulator
VCDFDAKDTVSFKLKWLAKNYVNLKAFLTLYKFAPDRTRTVIRTSAEAAKILLERLYIKGTLLEQMQQRNEEIRRLFAEGKTKTEIGRRLGLSARRVGQILNDSRI